jgi:hypothetical protein
MHIEQYKPEHYDRVVELIKEFYEKRLKNLGDIDDETIDKTIRLNTGDNAENVFMVKKGDKYVGIFAGREIDSEWGNHRIYNEIFWYFDKPYGYLFKPVIDMVQIELKKRGFNYIIVSMMEYARSAQADRIFKKMGFNTLETHYMRSL